MFFKKWVWQKFSMLLKIPDGKQTRILNFFMYLGVPGFLPAKIFQNGNSSVLCHDRRAGWGNV